MDTAEKKPRIKAPKNKLDEMLIDAARRGEIDTIVSLISQGANINATSRYFKDTPLMLAAERGYIDIVNILISTPGILINQTNKYRYSALIGAARFGHAAVIKALFTVNGILVNLQDEYGHTALILAVQSKKTEAVAALLDVPNIDITIESNQGRTALQEAMYVPSAPSALDCFYEEYDTPSFIDWFYKYNSHRTLLSITYGGPPLKKNTPIQINEDIVALLKYHETLLRSPLRSSTEPAPQEVASTLDSVLSKPVKSVTFSRDKENLKQPRSVDRLEEENVISARSKKMRVKKA
jgi:ankyrin repeat protein